MEASAEKCGSMDRKNPVIHAFPSVPIGALSLLWIILSWFLFGIIVWSYVIPAQLGMSINGTWTPVYYTIIATLGLVSAATKKYKYIHTFQIMVCCAFGSLAALFAPGSTQLVHAMRDRDQHYIDKANALSNSTVNYDLMIADENDKIICSAITIGVASAMAIIMVISLFLSFRAQNMCAKPCVKE